MLKCLSNKADSAVLHLIIGVVGVSILHGIASVVNQSSVNSATTYLAAISIFRFIFTDIGCFYLTPNASPRLWIFWLLSRVCPKECPLEAKRITFSYKRTSTHSTQKEHLRGCACAWLEENSPHLYLRNSIIPGIKSWTWKLLKSAGNC